MSKKYRTRERYKANREKRLAAASGSAAGPRIGKLTVEDAAMLKKLAEEMGALDCMPAWMRNEIEAKTKPPNAQAH